MSIILFTLGILFCQCNAEIIAPEEDPSIKKLVYLSCLYGSEYSPLGNRSVLQTKEFPGNSDSFWKRRSSKVPRQDVMVSTAAECQSNRFFFHPNHTWSAENLMANYYENNYCKRTLRKQRIACQSAVVDVLPKVKHVAWISHKSIHSLLKKIYIFSLRIIYYVGNSLLKTIRILFEGPLKNFPTWKLHGIYHSPVVSSSDPKDHSSLNHTEPFSCSPPRLPKLLEIPSFVPFQAPYDRCLSETHYTYKPDCQSDIRLQVGSSMPIVCYDPDPLRDVLWKKDGVVITAREFPIGMETSRYMVTNPFRFRPKSVNVFAAHGGFVLNLCEVELNDAGIYSCYLDGKLVQTFMLTVVCDERTRKLKFYLFLMFSVYISTSAMMALGTWILFKFNILNDPFPTTDDVILAETKENALDPEYKMIYSFKSLID